MRLLTTLISRAASRIRPNKPLLIFPLTLKPTRYNPMAFNQARPLTLKKKWIQQIHMEKFISGRHSRSKIA